MAQSHEPTVDPRSYKENAIHLGRLLDRQRQINCSSSVTNHMRQPWRVDKLFQVKGRKQLVSL